MQTSRRGVLAAAGAMSLPAASQAEAAIAPPHRPSVDDLVRRSHEANAALLRGDVQAYRQFVTLSDDFSFFSPFGGEPSRATAFTDDRFEAMGRFFRNGTLQTELVEAYQSGDLVVLALVERARVEVGDTPMQDWALRVTMVYRRAGDGWRLAHRHADPLRHGIDIKVAAAHARGR